jgi:hypothetical protein
MQPVLTAPGVAAESDTTGAVNEPDESWIVPVLIEFAGLLAVALRFDHVAVPARSAPAARIVNVAASVSPIPAMRPPIRLRELTGRAPGEALGAQFATSSGPSGAAGSFIVINPPELAGSVR